MYFLGSFYVFQTHSGTLEQHLQASKLAGVSGHPDRLQVWKPGRNGNHSDTLGCPPSQDSSHHQDYEPFLIGNPNLNLHFHYYWEGGTTQLILLMVQNSGKPVEVDSLSHYLQGFSTIPGGDLTVVHFKSLEESEIRGSHHPPVGRSITTLIYWFQLQSLQP